MSDPGRPLFNAASKGDVQRVRALLADGADPNRAVESVGALPRAARTPLAVAVQSDSLECVRVLVDAGASITDTDAEDSLIAQAHSLAMIELLLASGAQADAPTCFAHSVVVAVAEEDGMSIDERVRALQLLVAHGADLDAVTPHHTALWVSANQGDPDAVAALLAAGADPRTPPKALRGAVWSSYPGQNGATPEAIERTIDLLVAAGCDVNEPDDNGLMPLHGALMGYNHGDGYSSSDGCNGPAAAALIRHGAAVDVEVGGWQPIHLAAQDADVYGVRVLLEAGADPHARTPDGQTPADLVRTAIERMERRLGDDEPVTDYLTRHIQKAQDCLRLLE